MKETIISLMRGLGYMLASAIPHAGGVETNIAHRCIRPSYSQISEQSTTLAQGTASTLLIVRNKRLAGRFRCEVSISDRSCCRSVSRGEFGCTDIHNRNHSQGVTISGCLTLSRHLAKLRAVPSAQCLVDVTGVDNNGDPDLA